MGINKKITSFITECEKQLAPVFQSYDDVLMFNQEKVLLAMQKNRLAEKHFQTTTGYGYTDEGRDITEQIFADVFGAQRALVRPHIVSGTHAISTALFALLRPGDTLLSITGAPYDTIRTAIGINGGYEGQGTLADYNVAYKQVDLLKDGSFDLENIKASIDATTKVIYIQRSTGYSMRNALDIASIETIINFVKAIKADVLVIVDNCYGEFIEEKEPTQVGADLICGSLIKNPGGGIAPCGGYIAGTNHAVSLAAARLTSPGIAFEVGANLGVVRSYLQGFFLAPKVTNQALKSAVLNAQAFSNLDFEVFPKANAKRSDIIQAIVLKSREQILAFCKGIQAASPVDSYVTPLPWDMPGYESEVIMAAGNFISGSSIELSADSPMKEPYTVYVQGGLTYEHGKIGTMYAMQEMGLHNIL